MKIIVFIAYIIFYMLQYHINKDFLIWHWLFAVGASITSIKYFQNDIEQKQIHDWLKFYEIFVP